MRTINPKTHGFGAKPIAAQASIDIRLLKIKIFLVENLALKVPSEIRESIDAAARIASIAPIDSDENDFSEP